MVFEAGGDFSDFLSLQLQLVNGDSLDTVELPLLTLPFDCILNCTENVFPNSKGSTEVPVCSTHRFCGIP
jgi:hypothetical protein